MNIKITYQWLLDFLETKADPYQIQKYLSLAGPSIETVKKINNDYIFDIEIISNRIDTASVIGIAQEASAILPIYNIKAKLRSNPLELKFNKIANKLNDQLKLDVKIDKKLCYRFTALIFDDIKISSSPEFIKKRLQAAGIKVINNIVDISNYLMLTLGQPVHMFDYDKISGQKMILRSSKKDEIIKLLDNQVVKLPSDSIVIEDGEGELTDLCGIMGGAKSAINQNTKRIIFFVQTYNKEKIRKTVMTTGVRTLAATYFEKGLDEERVEPTIVYGVELIEKYAGGKIASNLTDIYSNSQKEKKLVVNYSVFKKIIGVEISKQIINQILKNLGFEIKDYGDFFETLVPSYRKNDIAIAEDLVEEVARIWGYHKIPSQLSPPALIIQPKNFDLIFKYNSKIKHFLKHLGLHEVINYSMISKDIINQWHLKKENHLQLANTISKEIEYLRLSLLPSLYKNIIDNTGKEETLKFFELAKVYWPSIEDLPKEVYKLAIAVNTDYFDLKGIVESLINELNITNIDLKIGITNNFYSSFFNKKTSITGLINNQEIVYLGQSKLNDKIFFTEINFEVLIKNANFLATYQPINPFATIKLDLTFKISQDKSFIEFKKNCLSISKLIQKIELINQYQDKITLRFYFSHPNKNLTEDEAKKELEKIKKII